MPDQAPERKTFLEVALRHERAVTAVLAILTLASWTWIVLMAQDMYGTMRGASAWMMTTQWDAAHVLLLCAMWMVMMVAMMLPSAAPLILLYAGASRARDARRASRDVYALAAGYVIVWCAFSVAATALQRILASQLMLTPMMEPATALVAAFLLAVAGIYQLTPLKTSCLRVCRSPLSFLLTRWRPGTLGALRLGIDHGIYCVGCCWALMMLLFAAGVMNLMVIVALVLWVLAEKFLPMGEQAAKASGILLLALAAWTAVG
jgi:predicted metal-binding membrane protein